uniref:Uncharacterized protein n=1 Tax=Rhizophora mucronata TaxID=61149 RepID=A0A2P2QTD4_RHIMU
MVPFIGLHFLTLIYISIFHFLKDGKLVLYGFIPWLLFLSHSVFTLA